MWGDLIYLSDSFTIATAAPFIVLSFMVTVQIIYNQVNHTTKTN